MRFCIYGAGAIGGYVAVELHSAGHDVCVIARGEHLRAIRERGLTLRMVDAVLALVQERGRIAGLYAPLVAEPPSGRTATSHHAIPNP